MFGLSTVLTGDIVIAVAAFVAGALVFRNNAVVANSVIGKVETATADVKSVAAKAEGTATSVVSGVQTAIAAASANAPK